MGKNTFISETENDSFSCMRGLDLREALEIIDTYYLTYRETLSLPSHVTFGIEIEYEKCLRTFVDHFIEQKFPEWTSKGDGSLDSGGEITSPILRDEKKYWEQLKMICQFLSHKDADTLHNAGGHIHIGANVLGADIPAWQTFLKLYIAYENVLLRFVFGDKINARKKLNQYAPPSSQSLYEHLPSIMHSRYVEDLHSLVISRYSALNLCNLNFYNPESTNTKNTLEFRSPNSTTEEVVWQNNINAFAKMLLSSKEDVMDLDFINYKVQHEFKSYSRNAYLYNEVHLKNALEFVDLVFDNNLDKVYFLRQYLKGFQDNYGVTSTMMAKKFIK